MPVAGDYHTSETRPPLLKLPHEPPDDARSFVPGSIPPPASSAAGGNTHEGILLHADAGADDLVLAR